MKPKVLLAELEQVAKTLDIRLSYEALAATVGYGGLCRVKGEHRIIIDKRASCDEKIAAIAKAVAKLAPPDLELHPDVRALVSFYTRGGRPEPLSESAHRP